MKNKLINNLIISYFNKLLLFCLFGVTVSQDFLPNKMTIKEQKAFDSIKYNHKPPKDFEIRGEKIDVAEFDDMQGVVTRWPYDDSSVKPLFREIVTAVSNHAPIYIIISSSWQQTLAENYIVDENLENIDPIWENIIFIIQPSNSIWARDYGPHNYIEKEDNFWIPKFSDFSYYPSRPLDDNIPQIIADYLEIPNIETPTFYHEGGNYMSDGLGNCFMNDHVATANPSWSNVSINNLFENYCGCAESYYETQGWHIDMGAKLFSPTQMFLNQADSINQYDSFTYFQDLFNYYNSLTAPDGGNYDYIRLPLPPQDQPRTYTNSLIINDAVLVPIYGIPLDDIALKMYKDAMPGYTIYGFDAEAIIPYFGAIHCVTHELVANQSLKIFAHRFVTNENPEEYKIISKAHIIGLNTDIVPELTLFYKSQSENNFNSTLMIIENDHYYANLSEYELGSKINYYIEGIAGDLYARYPRYDGFLTLNITNQSNIETDPPLIYTSNIPESISYLVDSSPINLVVNDNNTLVSVNLEYKYNQENLNSINLINHLGNSFFTNYSIPGEILNGAGLFQFRFTAKDQFDNQSISDWNLYQLNAPEIQASLNSYETTLDPNYEDSFAYTITNTSQEPNLVVDLSLSYNYSNISKIEQDQINEIIVEINNSISKSKIQAQKIAKMKRNVKAENKKTIPNIDKPIREYKTQTNLKNNRDEGGPDNFGYNWIDSNTLGGPNFDWFEISESGTAINYWNSSGNYYGADEGSAYKVLPFEFPFYENKYSYVRISSNGFITFNSIPSDTWENSIIPSYLGQDNLIAPFWADFDGTIGGDVYCYGDDEIYVIQFTNWPHYGTTITETFQIILHVDGHILIQYKDINDPSISSIGIENSNGTDGLGVSYNDLYPEANKSLLFIYPQSNYNLGWLISDAQTSYTLNSFESETLNFTISTENLDTGVYTAVIHIENNSFNNPSFNFPITVNVGESLIGDINADGSLNILDVVALVDIIINDENPSLNGDVNGDGSVDVIDIVMLVDIIVGD